MEVHSEQYIAMKDSLIMVYHLLPRLKFLWFPFLHGSHYLKTPQNLIFPISLGVPLSSEKVTTGTENWQLFVVLGI